MNRSVIVLGLMLSLSISNAFSADCAYGLDSVVFSKGKVAVKNFLKKNPEYKTPDCLGKALIESTKLQKNKISHYLISLGANVNFVQVAMSTTNATIEAIQNQDLESLKLLGDAGADFNFYLESAGNYRNALYATSTYQDSPVLVEYLLSKGANPNAMLFSCRNSSVLNELIWRAGISNVYTADQLKIAQLLLENGANPNHKTKQCGDIRPLSILESAQEIAGRGGDNRMLDLVISYGATN